MSPQGWLLFGCFGLGTIITYCWWATIRTSLFRLRLAEIRDELDAATSKNGHASHQSYVNARRTINWMIESAPFFSMPIFLVFKRLRSPSEQQVDGIGRQVGQNTEINGMAEDDDDEVRLAIVQICIAATCHVVITPSFLGYFLWTTLSGRSEHLISELPGLISEMTRMSRDYRAVEGLAATLK